MPLYIYIYKACPDSCLTCEGNLATDCNLCDSDTYDGSTPMPVGRGECKLPCASNEFRDVSYNC